MQTQLQLYSSVLKRKKNVFAPNILQNKYFESLDVFAGFAPHLFITPLLRQACCGANFELSSEKSFSTF